MSQNTIRKKPRKNKKYRFQLLYVWLTSKYLPTSALDVGGGKGLLTYLLNSDGWDCTVVDPVSDFRPIKYKQLDTNIKIKLTKKQQSNIPRIVSEFNESMVVNYNLIIGLHAHGCNIKILEACKKYNKDFLLLPCCVIDEPIDKKQNINWLESLVEYADNLGFNVKRDVLDFKGQNILIYTDSSLKKIH